MEIKDFIFFSILTVPYLYLNSSTFYLEDIWQSYYEVMGTRIFMPGSLKLELQDISFTLYLIMSY